MNIGEVLTRSWKIIWKHKILWLFGVLASCARASGSGGGGGGGSQSSQILPGVERYFAWNSGGKHFALSIPPQSIFDLESPFLQSSSLDFWVVVFIILGSILLITLLVMLAVSMGAIGQIGVIKGAQKADQEVDKLKFSDLLVEVKRFFWRVLGLSLIAGGIVFLGISFIVLFFTAFTAVTLGFGIFCLIPFIFLLIPVLWGFSIVIKQVIIAIVTEDLTLSLAIQVGWKLFWSNLRVMIPMTLILDVGLTVIVGIVLVIPIFIVFVPGAIGLMINTSESTTIGLILSLIAGIIYLPVMILLSGILQTYTLTSWTLTFIRLRSKNSGESDSPAISSESA